MFFKLHSAFVTVCSRMTTVLFGRGQDFNFAHRFFVTRALILPVIIPYGFALIVVTLTDATSVLFSRRLGLVLVVCALTSKGTFPSRFTVKLTIIHYERPATRKTALKLMGLQNLYQALFRTILKIILKMMDIDKNKFFKDSKLFIVIYKLLILFI